MATPYRMTRDEALKRLTAAGEPYEIVQQQVGRRHLRVFKNAPQTLGDLYATTRSDKTFIVFEDERLSFEDTWRLACTFAQALVDQYGVVPGDRVAISARNYPEWIITFMAATSIGAIAVAMNALWQPQEMEYGLADSSPGVLVADQERLDRLVQVAQVPDGLKVIGIRTGLARSRGPWGPLKSPPDERSSRRRRV